MEKKCKTFNYKFIYSYFAKNEGRIPESFKEKSDFKDLIKSKFKIKC